MNFVTPSRSELAALRADPLLVEQELDVRPNVAEAMERVLGFRAGRAYWRSSQGSLYGIDLADLGRGRPSMAFVYGFWPRYEPRPLDDHAIDRDLAEFCLWMAEACDGLNRDDVAQTLDRAMRSRPAG